MTRHWITTHMRGFVCGRPPLLVFTFCLVSFAVVLLSVSLYLKHNNVDDLDIHKNWNTFLKNFADMEFCVNSNLTSVNRTSPIATSPMPSRYRNYSIPLLLKIRPTSEFLRFQHNMTYLKGEVTGRDLGLQGKQANARIIVTFKLPVYWNVTHCTSGICKPLKVLTCAYLVAPAFVFPQSSAPAPCHVMANETVMEYHATMTSHRDWHYAYPYCGSHTKITVQYKWAQNLKVMLSIGDKSIINLHLLHTSYFLFVMVLTLVCYALIKGSSNKSKAIQTDKYSQMS